MFGPYTTRLILIIAKEVSEWDSPYDLNHMYLFNDSMTKAYGYIRNRDLKATWFKNPMSISTKYRKFEILERIKEEDTIEVKGSSGNVYTVKKSSSGYKCSCVGFKYHGRCKHIDLISDNP